MLKRLNELKCIINTSSQRVPFYQAFQTHKNGQQILLLWIVSMHEVCVTVVLNCIIGFI